jgi:hypothetical protein
VRREYQNKNKAVALELLGTNLKLIYSEMYVVFGKFCMPGCWIRYPIAVL